MNQAENMSNQNAQHTPPMVTQKDICAAFGISKVTLWRWRESGRIPPGSRIGHAVYWPPGTIEQILIDHESTPKTRAS